MTVAVRVPAKVNLGLRSGARDATGYHPLATIFQAVSVYDDVLADAADDTTVTVTGELAHQVPVDGSNLAVRAVELLAERTGARRGIALQIRKNIPVAGGMAGGSADAAAALVAADALWETGLDRSDLAGLAAEIGSDVPFPLVGFTAVGTGRGHLLTPVLAQGEYHWVFATQSVGLSTPAVFGVFDELNPVATLSPEPDRDVLHALRSGDPAALGRALTNDLQPAALRLAPHVADTLAVAREAGALGAVVSGSGPTVAALARSAQHALGVAAGITAAGVADRVLVARGPVAGARLLT